MKVLLVTHGAKDMTTAVYRNTIGRARFLQQLGHDVHVLTPPDVGMGHYGRAMPLVYPIVVAWWILRRPPFDVITFHSHTGWVYALLRTLIASQRHTAVAVTFHGLDILYVRALAAEAERRGGRQTVRFRVLHAHLLPRLARLACRRATRVFCMNASERRFLLEHEWCDERRLRWMPNCITDRDFVARNHSASPVRFLTMAQWLPVKGMADVVDAFSTLAHKGLDIHLTCAGTRKEADVVLRAFPEDVRARVTVIPLIAHEDVGQVYAAADVFVLASVFEGFSIALLEAMAAGLAIVATDAGAASQILDPGYDAAIVPVGEAAALASAMEAFVLDPVRRGEFGARARARAADFTCDRVLPRFAEDLLGVPADLTRHAAV